MWIVLAFGSALFAGITAILAKCGIRKTDSNVATAIRTVVVLLFSWLMVLLTGSHWGDWQENMAVPYPVRTCHRRVLALLFQGVAAWRYQQGGSC